MLKSKIPYLGVLFLLVVHLHHQDYVLTLMNLLRDASALLLIVGAVEFFKEYMSGHESNNQGALKKMLLALSALILIMCKHSKDGTIEEFRQEMFARFVPMLALVLLRVHVTKLESEERAKHLNINLGSGLARNFFQFVENVIKGKGLSPSHVEALRRVARDEKFLEETHWVCPKTLILFPEGKFPFNSWWGSRKDLLAKEKETSNPHSFCKSFDVKHTYEVSGGIERTSALEGIQIKRNGRNSVAIVIENRPLITLMKLVNYPVKMDNKAEMVSEQTFKTHFMCFKNELKRLLDNDPQCRGKYEIVHYKENGKQQFSDLLINLFNKIEKEESSQKVDVKVEENVNQGAMNQTFVDSPNHALRRRNVNVPSERVDLI